MPARGALLTMAAGQIVHYVAELVMLVYLAATKDAHASRRSVGDHASCDQMFDKDMVTAVMQKERDLVSRYQMDGCC